MSKENKEAHPGIIHYKGKHYIGVDYLLPFAWRYTAPKPSKIIVIEEREAIRYEQIEPCTELDQGDHQDLRLERAREKEFISKMDRSLTRAERKESERYSMARASCDIKSRVMEDLQNNRRFSDKNELRLEVLPSFRYVDFWVAIRNLAINVIMGVISNPALPEDKLKATNHVAQILTAKAALEVLA